jgi:hypothetical protein
VFLKILSFKQGVKVAIGIYVILGGTRLILWHGGHLIKQSSTLLWPLSFLIGILFSIHNLALINWVAESTGHMIEKVQKSELFEVLQVPCLALHLESVGRRVIVHVDVHVWGFQT